ncbi:hypothetical protein P7C70_g365, partial [Phenoliferia sp. Uapishka_3]
MARSKPKKGGFQSFRSLTQRGSGTPSGSTSTSDPFSATPSRLHSPSPFAHEEPASATRFSQPNSQSYNRPRLSNDSDNSTSGVKRSIEAAEEGEVDQSGETAGKRIKKRKRKGKVIVVPAEGEQEDGQIDEFEGLIMIDTAPSAVRIEDPVEPEEELSKQEQEARADRLQQTALEKEEEAMRAFAQEVADSEASDSGDEEDENEDEVRVEMAVYDDPDALQKAIQGKITDDSAAKVRLNFLVGFYRNQY